jgi:hypothetical protein
VDCEIDRNPLGVWIVASKVTEIKKDPLQESYANGRKTLQQPERIDGVQRGHSRRHGNHRRRAEHRQCVLALGGLTGWGQEFTYGLIAVSFALGCYLTYRFIMGALKVEPLND